MENKERLIKTIWGDMYCRSIGDTTKACVVMISDSQHKDFLPLIIPKRQYPCESGKMHKSAFEILTFELIADRIEESSNNSSYSNDAYWLETFITDCLSPYSGVFNNEYMSWFITLDETLLKEYLENFYWGKTSEDIRKNQSKAINRIGEYYLHFN